MRLRDGAMTCADRDLWKSRDIYTKGCDPDLVRRAGGFLWLCAENADCGQRNGGKLGEHAAASGVPIFRDVSLHIDEVAKRQKPEEFTGIRTATHLAVGAPAMLTSNRIYGVDTVLIGLMNASP